MQKLLYFPHVHKIQIQTLTIYTSLNSNYIQSIINVTYNYTYNESWISLFFYPDVC